MWADPLTLSGEIYALLAALAYGGAGVSIGFGKGKARGDNGVYLSVLLTAGMSGLLWLVWGSDFAITWSGVALFVLAGVFSTVLGRVTMYRATEHIGAVETSLLRRLTPVFAVVLAVVFLHQIPGIGVLAGGILVLLAVAVYLYGPVHLSRSGVMLGLASPLFYAAAYTLRAAGLGSMPDALFGVFLGALVGCIWFPISALAWGKPLRVDRGGWQWLTAGLLSIGQIFQFFALKYTSVASVAVIGTLEVFFSALILLALRTGTVNLPRLLIALALATLGTALVFSR